MFTKLNYNMHCLGAPSLSTDGALHSLLSTTLLAPPPPPFVHRLSRAPLLYFTLCPGHHTLHWVYSKDSHFTAGDDIAIISVRTRAHTPVQYREYRAKKKDIVCEL